MLLFQMCLLSEDFKFTKWVIILHDLMFLFILNRIFWVR